MRYTPPHTSQCQNTLLSSLPPHDTVSMLSAASGSEVATQEIIRLVLITKVHYRPTSGPYPKLDEAGSETHSSSIKSHFNIIYLLVPSSRGIIYVSLLRLKDSISV
jgi:hypothetical protein